VELAQLVEMPIKALEARQGAWSWREWQVLPVGEGRWRLRRGAAGSDHSTSGSEGDG
jgi:ribonuclease HI